MNYINRISFNPWDYTLYQIIDGGFVLKVIFSEGVYKVDIERYFLFAADEIIKPLDTEYMKVLLESIRCDYARFQSQEITKSQFQTGFAIVDKDNDSV
ncbi:hypothetical protein SAMN04487787_10927 [Kosakonia sacchari]|nr:hypothetical protein SAMN04487787_10927 [Kosakonia sacchari]